jgi:HSP20 family molecular chaperone IbpA
MSIDLTKFWLGLDNNFMPTYTESSYPRYNLIESGSGFRIDIAVPGWNKTELEIIADGEELHIKGNKQHKLDEGERFLHQGFILNPDLQVKDVNLQDGLLTIQLTRTPNSKRKILEIK